MWARCVHTGGIKNSTSTPLDQGYLEIRNPLVVLRRTSRIRSGTRQSFGMRTRRIGLPSHRKSGDFRYFDLGSHNMRAFCVHVVEEESTSGFVIVAFRSAKVAAGSLLSRSERRLSRPPTCLVTIGTTTRGLERTVVQLNQSLRLRRVRINHLTLKRSQPSKGPGSTPDGHQIRDSSSTRIRRKQQPQRIRKDDDSVASTSGLNRIQRLPAYDLLMPYRTKCSQASNVNSQYKNR